MDELFFLLLFQVVFGNSTGSLHSPFYLSACGISLFLWYVGYFSLEREFRRKAGKPFSEIPWNIFYRLVSLLVVVFGSFQ